MKKFLLCLAALSASISCERPEWSFYPSGGQAHDSENCSGVEEIQDDDPPEVVPDTTIWITAVIIPEGYDWRKDSAYLQSHGEILLLENFAVKHRIQAGRNNNVSMATDMHVCIDGELYTQYSGGNHTYIKRNGSSQTEYQGQEIIRGIASEDKDILSLGESRDRQGFSLRRNGAVVYSNDSGTIWGNLNDPSFPETGALIPVNEGYCFVWRESSARTSGWNIYDTGTGKSTKLSQDHITDIMDLRPIDNGTIMVGKNRDGQLVLRENDNNTVISGSVFKNLQSCRLYCNANSEPAVVIKNRDNGTSLVWDGKACNILSSKALDFILREGDNFIGISRDSRGNVSLSTKTGRMKSLDGSYYLFNSHCACICGGKLYMALTPVDENKKPVLWIDGEIREMDIEGYLTGVYVKLSLPR